MATSIPPYAAHPDPWSEYAVYADDHRAIFRVMNGAREGRPIWSQYQWGKYGRLPTPPALR